MFITFVDKLILWLIKSDKSNLRRWCRTLCLSPGPGLRHSNTRCRLCSRDILRSRSGCSSERGWWSPPRHPPWLQKHKHKDGEHFCSCSGIHSIPCGASINWQPAFVHFKLTANYSDCTQDKNYSGVSNKSRISHVKIKFPSFLHLHLAALWHER